MSYTYSKKSQEKLDTCHVFLQMIANELIKEMDCTILEGERGKEKQDEAFANKKSKLKYPDSLHNINPKAGREKAWAMDVAPFPIDWNNIAKFNLMCDKIEAIAKRLNIKVRMGRTFSFKDYPHVELDVKWLREILQKDENDN